MNGAMPGTAREKYQKPLWILNLPKNSNKISSSF
jgi:hypothetical protein